MKIKYVVGIDEVGRGPLAGPLTLGFVFLSLSEYNTLKKDRSLPKAGFDSKKLTFKLREEYNNYLVKKIKIKHVLINVSNKNIDRFGLSFSIKKAIKDGLKKLKVLPKETQVLLDGGLKAPEEFIFQKTIIKGDEKEKIISWASIIAKVSRDKFMEKISKKHPDYFFEIHKGYGTKVHRELIIKNGLSSIHRKSFCKFY